MSSSLDTDLMYGYSLGGAEAEWDLGLYSDEDSFTLAWPEWVELDGADEDEPEDFITQAQERLVKVLTAEIAGFTEPEPDWQTEKEQWHDWLQAQAQAKKGAGIGSGTGSIEFARTGIRDYSDWVMGIKIASGDALLTLDGRQLTQDLHENTAKWTQQVNHALGILEVRPDAFPVPALLVVASYG